MQAMAFRAEEHLRNLNPKDALKIFFALCKPNRFETSYWRGAAMCFQHLKEYGYAHGFYGMALATHADDRISEALRAECTLRLSGHQKALGELAQLLCKPVIQDAAHGPYMQRAQLLHDKLSSLPRKG